MNLLLLTTDWVVVSSVSAAVTALVSLFTTLITLKINKESDLEKQLSVQPWLYIQNISRMGASAPIQLVIKNDGYLNIHIRKVELVLYNQNNSETLDFKYVKDNDKSEVGKFFIIAIPWKSEYFGKPFQIKISYQNLYKKQMEAVSDRLHFVDQIDNSTLADIKKKDAFFKPFYNTYK